MMRRTLTTRRRMTQGVAVVWLLAAGMVTTLYAQDRSGSSDGDQVTSIEQLSPAQRGELRERVRARTYDDFDKSGVVPGGEVLDLAVYTRDGRETRLSELWKDRPALLVTASLTCPRARERQSSVEEIAQRFGDRLNVVVVYSIEAHPVTDPSPYASYSPELENPERPGERLGGNDKVGLERRQPTTLDERRKLAGEYQELLHSTVPIVLDRMSNEAWLELGGGPNIAVLVDRGGKVVVKHGWFDGETMMRSIEHFLAEQGSGGS